ncbi:MAG: cell division protein ZapA [Chitinophagaceae bacterium]|nr:cell division protein ZapA [Chitinophagaceae bacterium]
MQDLVPINIVIGDRTYRIKIDPANEEIIRKTVKLVNDKIVEFKTVFAGKDMQDYTAMVLIWYATIHDSQTDLLGEKELQEKLHAFEASLDKALQENAL